METYNYYNTENRLFTREFVGFKKIELIKVYNINRGINKIYFRKNKTNIGLMIFYSNKFSNFYDINQIVFQHHKPYID